MRKLIVTEFVSLDGVVEAPGGEPGYAHTGWVLPFHDEELVAYKTREQVDTDTLLLGRVTYESFADAWPEREGELADKINTMEKFVVSTTIGDPGWEHVSVLRTIDEVAALKERDGGDILVVGSRTLAQALLAAGLVDRLHLAVFPLVLGSGARLYPDSADKLTLDLDSSELTPSGVMLQEYDVVH